MSSILSFLNIANEKNRRIAYTIHQSNNNHQIDNKANTVFICVPSLGDVKEEYRFLVPRLTSQGYKVLTVDHRGLGESDVNFSSYAAHDCGQDLVQLIDKEVSVNQKAIIVGNSMAGAAGIWAAAERPQKVGGLVLINAFVRDHPFPFGMSTLLWVLCNNFIGPSFWSSYYQSLYTLKPSTVSDLKEYSHQLKKNLNQPGRMYATKMQLFASKAPCTARINEVNKYQIPTIAIFGDKDPDFPAPNGPEKEAQWIADTVNQPSAQTKKSDIASYEMVVGAGHYPHVEAPEQVSNSILSFVNRILSK
eukprot:CAMPEP_0173154740 /NCGR_PEP_ID=MMETSP1105-20130129/13667_1 /TAXON_ID=2985 /ORGANISM="Ochromonas sp., Strain BG-1" /LENGTH=304 /DNA_ID=CAMNT_0014070987 /DNA_START=126 /DNA_END=1040 /DNA_ORIENTATION=-